MNSPDFDVVIVGGGPAGLAGALALGRGRKRVLLCDEGPPRNAAATHVHNFVTRDGTPPTEFRAIAHRQLEKYASVEIRAARVRAITGERDGFSIELANGTVSARRVLLCTGMIDEPPPWDGVAPLWGHSIFACPYCHGWEIRDQRFGCLVPDPDAVAYAQLLRGWTRDVVAFTDGRFTVSAENAGRLERSGIRLEERPIARLHGQGGQLTEVELAGGERIARDALFLHPHQRQVDLVTALGLSLDSAGYVETDPEQRETSRPGIYAAGDLIHPVQSATGAAAAGAHAAARINRELTIALAESGLLD
jgi:thioredoxin reductase